jgi:hypothetical protein
VYGFPRFELPGGAVVEDPHPEHLEHVQDHRWLLHSWIGGRTYRDATYGPDYGGYMIRNLFRNKREYATTDKSSDRWASEFDYEKRRNRTPVPTLMAECVGKHLSKVFSKEIRREGPPEVMEWWGSVNRRRETIDHWWRQAVAPMVVVMANLDILCDRPVPPKGRKVRSKADEEAYGLHRCLTSYVLPENMVWWTLAEDETYEQCLVREVCDDGTRYRWWGPDRWVLYTDKGEPVKGPDGEGEHDAGCCPITRLFDRRNPLCRNVGMSRYTPTAEHMREFYNRDSELVLSDSNQAFPILQAPEKYTQEGSEIPVGVGHLIPMAEIRGSDGSVSGYVPWEMTDWPKGSSESLRLNKQDLRDAVDRHAGMTKPAGAQGSTGNTVAQSGISKQLDQDDGNSILAEIAATLARCEIQVATMAYRVITGGKVPEPGAIVVEYPQSFSLLSGSELADDLGKFQLGLAGGGNAPLTEARYLKAQVRKAHPGLADAEYAAMDAEIEGVLNRPPEPPAVPIMQPMQPAEIMGDQ